MFFIHPLWMMANLSITNGLQVYFCTYYIHLKFFYCLNFNLTFSICFPVQIVLFSLIVLDFLKRTSYFKISCYLVANWICEFKFSLFFCMCSVHFCIKSSFETTELLIFHRPEHFFKVCWKEQKRAYWSVEMASKISEFLATFWKL